SRPSAARSMSCPPPWERPSSSTGPSPWPGTPGRHLGRNEHSVRGRREPPMRIVDLEVLVLGASWRHLTFLKLHTDDGLVGLGEARLTNRTEALLAYLDAVKGRYIV